eukprot:tig00021168_g19076.t1
MATAAAPRIADLASLAGEQFDADLLFDDPEVDREEVFKIGCPIDRLNVVSAGKNIQKVRGQNRLVLRP